MRKIMPCLWFDHQAMEAVQFYTAIFDRSKIVQTTLYGDAGPRPKGTILTVIFRLLGQDFTALNGGPAYRITPAISFFVSCRTERELDALWRKLSEGGTVLMELQAYPFSKKFGWVSDRFGVSWQLTLTGTATTIAPLFTFVGKQHGKAEEAIKVWISLFRDSRIDHLERYSAGQEGPVGTVQHARFVMAGQTFMAMDSNREHQFAFTPGLSMFVNCETQEEIDRLWEKLSDGGQPQQCGWVTDRYGVSWQIVPSILGELLGDGMSTRSAKVMAALLQMNKLDMKGLQQAAAQ